MDNKVKKYPFGRLQLVVQAFEHSPWWIKIKIQYCPQSCLVNEKENDIIKLWGPV